MAGTSNSTLMIKCNRTKGNNKICDLIKFISYKRKKLLSSELVHWIFYEMVNNKIYGQVCGEAFENVGIFGIFIIMIIVVGRLV